MLAVVLALFAASECGHSLRSNASHVPPSVAQVYHRQRSLLVPRRDDSEDGLQFWSRRRQLKAGDQVYPTSLDGDSFLSLAEAHERDILKPMRVVYDYELVEEEKDPDMCTSVGQANVLAVGGVCSEDDIVTPEKFAVLTKRLTWLGGFIGNMLRLKPVQDPILVTPAALRAWAGIEGNVAITNVSHADLFIYVTMKPDPSGVVAGYAQVRPRGVLSAQVLTLPPAPPGACSSSGSRTNVP